MYGTDDDMMNDDILTPMINDTLIIPIVVLQTDLYKYF